VALSSLTQNQEHPHNQTHQDKHFRDTTIIVFIIIGGMIMQIVSGFMNASFCVCLFIIYLLLVALNFHSLVYQLPPLFPFPSFFLSANCQANDIISYLYPAYCLYNGGAFKY